MTDTRRTFAVDPTALNIARANARRTARRARRTGMAAAFFPVFAVYLAVDAWRVLHERFVADRAIERERRPTFARPAEMPTGDARSVADIAATIESFPYEPAAISTQTAFFRSNGSDALGSLLHATPRASTRARQYPAEFQQELFVGSDGERIVGMRAMHDHPGPALIICHGLLMTKNFDMIIELAQRAFERWGFHVVTLDLRGWGQTSWTSHAPSSAGFHEGADVVEVARMLHESHLVTSVGAVGFSLGGSTVLNAARHSSQSPDSPIDGGVLALSAPTDLREALEYISRV
ncbi:MAG: hypothetical protein JWN41_356, partial [Thermoleophilia bacterium]|nr:hypothetical protein [Thermoleophilia bacterium]